MTAWLLICCHSIAKLSLHPLHLESYHISVHFWTLTIAHLIFFKKVFKIFVIMEVITFSILFFATCTHIEGSNFTFKEINSEFDQQRFISKPKTSFYRGLSSFGFQTYSKITYKKLILAKTFIKFFPIANFHRKNFFFFRTFSSNFWYFVKIFTIFSNKQLK